MMAFKTMEWIRSVRDRDWEETKKMSLDERQHYFEEKRKKAEERLAECQSKKHKTK
jgi:hypothetical protein